MQRCQFSKLTIPNDVTYAEASGVYALEVARILGFDEQACEDIKAGVADAVSHIMRKAFDPGQEAALEVSCERVPMGLEVVVKDQGLPFSPSDVPFQDNLHEISDGVPWDEVSLHNLGQEGKETHFIKYLQNPAIEYHDICELPLLEQEQARLARSPERIEFEVRPMLPSEAIEVARCFYLSYGYSFVFQQIYYPDRIVELNEAGRLFSVVAVTNDGEIIGHCAFVRWDKNPDIAELGFAAVKPEFRGHGCLRRLTEYLIDKAKRNGLEAVYVLAATNHTHSQKAALRFGFKPCALLAGLGPASVSFRELTDVLPQRESYLVCFNFLFKPKPVTLYVPDHRIAFVRELYHNLGVEPFFVTPSKRELEFLQPNSKVKTLYFTTTGFGFIEIDEYGADIVAEIKAALRDLCLKRIEVIELYCDMANPLMYKLAREFEKMGFFPGGIKPMSSHGEAMIFQYLNNVLIDYDKIKTLTPEGDRIRSYLRSVDPNYVEGGDA